MGHGGTVSYNCISCKKYFNGYCELHRIRVGSDDCCKYYEYSIEIKLPPDGRHRVTAVAAKKHVTIFTKRKRGPTDPELKELRRRLERSGDLPFGSRLRRSKSDGSVYVRYGYEGYGWGNLNDPRRFQIAITQLATIHIRRTPSPWQVAAGYLGPPCNIDAFMTSLRDNRILAGARFAS